MNTKIFSPINNNLGNNFDLQPFKIKNNPDFATKKERVIDRINFIETKTNMELNIKKVGNFH